MSCAETRVEGLDGSVGTSNCHPLCTGLWDIGHLRCNSHMRNVLLFSFILAGAVTLAAQTSSTGTAPAKQVPATGAAAPAPAPAKPAPAPATGAATTTKPAPATTTTAPAKPAAATDAAAAAKQTTTKGTGATKTAGTAGRTTTTAPARSGITLVVTDKSGRTLEGVQVEMMGPTPRQDQTNPLGQLNFPQIQAGTYLLRFTGDAVTTFEREVQVAAGKIPHLDISLSPAPPPREVIKEVAAPAPAPTPIVVVGPPGQAQLTSLYDIAESELKLRTPRREMLVACSGNLRSTMILLAEKDQTSLPTRMYDSAEVSYYILGGEATVRIGDTEKNLAAGGYAAVPRGAPVTIARKGNKPLSLLSMLSGEPCEQAK